MMSQQAWKTWDHSVCVFDKHQMKFETLDSKIAEGLMKIFLADFKRKINFLEDSIQEAMSHAQRKAGSCIKYNRLSTTIKLSDIR